MLYYHVSLRHFRKNLALLRATDGQRHLGAGSEPNIMVLVSYTLPHLIPKASRRGEF